MPSFHTLLLHSAWESPFLVFPSQWSFLLTIALLFSHERECGAKTWVKNSEVLWKPWFRKPGATDMPRVTELVRNLRCRKQYLHSTAFNSEFPGAEKSHNSRNSSELADPADDSDHKRDQYSDSSWHNGLITQNSMHTAIFSQRQSTVMESYKARSRISHVAPRHSSTA